MSFELESEIEKLNQGLLPEAGQWQWIASSANTKVAFRSEAPRCYYKGFLSRGKLESLKALVRGSRCQRAVINANILTGAGFNTPKVLAYQAKGPLPWMLTEAVDGLGYGDFMASRLRTPMTPEKTHQKFQLVRAVGTLVGRLHHQGLVHGDLRPNNLIVVDALGQLELHLIDNERNQCFSRIPEKLIFKNLVQINMLFGLDLNHTNRHRFFLAYFSECQRYTPTVQRELMTKVYQRVQVRLEGKTPEDIVNCQRASSSKQQDTSHD